MLEQKPPMDSEDGMADTNASQCVKNWIAALPNSLKSMFTRFDETGLFVALCRHGLIEFVCDMI